MTDVACAQGRRREDAGEGGGKRGKGRAQGVVGRNGGRSGIVAIGTRKRACSASDGICMIDLWVPGMGLFRWVLYHMGQSRISLSAPPPKKTLLRSSDMYSTGRGYEGAIILPLFVLMKMKVLEYGLDCQCC